MKEYFLKVVFSYYSKEYVYKTGYTDLVPGDRVLVAIDSHNWDVAIVRDYTNDPGIPYDKVKPILGKIEPLRDDLNTSNDNRNTR